MKRGAMAHLPGTPITDQIRKLIKSKAPAPVQETTKRTLAEAIALQKGDKHV